MDHEDDCSPELDGLFSASGARIDTEGGYTIVVRVDRATQLTTLDVEDSEGVLVDNRVLGVEDLQRLHDILTAAWEHARAFDVPVALDLSEAIGRD
jgi:hypothetical protein